MAEKNSTSEGEYTTPSQEPAFTPRTQTFSPKKSKGKSTSSSQEQIPTLKLVGSPRKRVVSSSDSGTSDEGQSTAEHDKKEDEKQTTPRRKRAARNRRDPAYIENGKTRTVAAKDRMHTLQIKAHDLVTKCGALVYLKMQYEGPSGKHCAAKFGKDFLFANEHESPKRREAKAMEDAIHSAVEESFKKHFPSTSKGYGVSSQEYGESPTVAHKGNRKRNGCVYCNQTSEDLAIMDRYGNVTKHVETLILQCAFQEGACPRVAHADCIGFPGVTKKIAAKMPDWYCKMHISDGRRETQTKIHSEKETKKGSGRKQETKKKRLSVATETEEESEPQKQSTSKRSKDKPSVFKRLFTRKKKSEGDEVSSDDQAGKSKKKSNQELDSSDTGSRRSRSTRGKNK